MVDTTMVYPEIGKRIRCVRDLRKLTQEELAKRLGLSRVSVVNIEAGRQQTPVHRLYEIALLLDCDVDALMPPSLQDRLVGNSAAVSPTGAATGEQEA